MANLRITVSAPVRYAKWPAGATRTVGTLLAPGEELLIPEREERFYRFVAVGDVAKVELTKTRIVPNEGTIAPELGAAPEVAA